MSKQEIIATDMANEEKKGRVALWLDADDIAWLAKHCCCNNNEPSEIIERCSRIRFRANAALHKAGYKI